MPKLLERVEKGEQEPEGGYDMCAAIDEMMEDSREEGREEGREESLLSNLKTLMKKLKLTVEQAMDMLDVPPESRKALALKLNNENP